MEMLQMTDWQNVLHVLGNIVIVAGLFFTVSAGIGMMRMPDFYTRLHPAGVMDSMGAPLILVGLTLHSTEGLVAVKLILLIFFLIITGPTACHALAKAALSSGVKPEKTIHEAKK